MQGFFLRQSAGRAFIPIDRAPAAAHALARGAERRQLTEAARIFSRQVAGEKLIQWPLERNYHTTRVQRPARRTASCTRIPAGSGCRCCARSIRPFNTPNARMATSDVLRELDDLQRSLGSAYRTPSKFERAAAGFASPKINSYSVALNSAEVRPPAP